jgi:hypothetical protein
MKNKKIIQLLKTSGFHWVQYTNNNGTTGFARVRSSKFRSAVTFMGGLLNLPWKTYSGVKETN